MRSNSKKKHLTWTQNRSRGHAISHAESMMAWHTARSLNIGSWTATCIECKKKGKRKGKGKRGERDFFSLSLAKEAEGRGSDLSRLRPFAPATFRGRADVSRAAEPLMFLVRSQSRRAPVATKTPPLSTPITRVDDIASRSESLDSKDQKAPPQLLTARGRKKKK